MSRRVLEFENSIGDGVQFTTTAEKFRVHCHSDYCGDTETGFGAEVGYDLSQDEARELHQFLGAWFRGLAAKNE